MMLIDADFSTWCFSSETGVHDIRDVCLPWLFMMMPSVLYCFYGVYRTVILHTWVMLSSNSLTILSDCICFLCVFKIWAMRLIPQCFFLRWPICNRLSMSLKFFVPNFKQTCNPIQRGWLSRTQKNSSEQYNQLEELCKPPISVYF